MNTKRAIYAEQSYRGWCLFFFFQAEDGIRDYKVTGVQTCALPIWGWCSTAFSAASSMVAADTSPSRSFLARMARPSLAEVPSRRTTTGTRTSIRAKRSEERRVGKEGRSRWSPYH